MAIHFQFKNQTKMKFKISQKTKNELWWLLISVDYDNSRITIADYEFNDQNLTLWLEDKHDFKNRIDECLQVVIPVADFAKLIVSENLNSYEGTKTHPTKNFVYKTRIEINEPLKWYEDDATLTEQQWAREAVLSHLLKQLIETTPDLQEA